jgi:hypothetical protein
MSPVTRMSASMKIADPRKSHSHGTRNRENVNVVSPRRLIGNVSSFKSCNDTGRDERQLIESCNTDSATGCRSSAPMNTRTGSRASFLEPFSSLNTATEHLRCRIYRSLDHAVPVPAVRYELYSRRERERITREFPARCG